MLPFPAVGDAVSGVVRRDLRKAAGGFKGKNRRPWQKVSTSSVVVVLTRDIGDVVAGGQYNLSRKRQKVLV